MIMTLWTLGLINVVCSIVGVMLSSTTPAQEDKRALGCFFLMTFGQGAALLAAGTALWLIH